MKNLTKTKALLAVLLVIACFYACKKDVGTSSSKNLTLNGTDLVSVSGINFTQTNLVADTAGFGAARIDTNLSNAWGIAVFPNGPIWISSNHKGVSVIYNDTGKALRPPVTIPSLTAGMPGAPDGVVFNSSPTSFGGNKFIFASEDGIVAAWGGGNSATTVADRSKTGLGAVYKGISLANNGTVFLCVTNFRSGTVDVFDENFHFVTDHRFVDPTIPTGFAPFNVQTIDGRVFVTYAKQKPDKHDDQAGPGNGYIDVFWPNGTLIKRFASQGTLNSPWGITFAPAGTFGNGPAILIGNFGDGRINVFDMSGNFMGQLQKNGEPITIDGLWGLDILHNNEPGGTSANPIYFTAGPNEESHGLFGTLQK